MLLSTLRPLAGLILLDATVGPESEDMDHVARVLTMVVWSKPDTWMSREVALKMFRSMPGYRSWDPRALELFVVRLTTYDTADESLLCVGLVGTRLESASRVAL